jgi:hypothetical protein
MGVILGLQVAGKICCDRQICTVDLNHCPAWRGSFLFLFLFLFFFFFFSPVRKKEAARTPMGISITIMGEI